MIKLRTVSLILLFISQFSYAQNKAPLVKQWDKRFGGIGADNLSASQQTRDGGYILGGVSYSDNNGDKTQPGWALNGGDYWVVKIDSLGNKQWDKRFGGTGSDVLGDLEQTTDGGYILGGESNSDSSGDKTQNGRALNDYWVVKIDSLGNKQWDKRFGGTGNDLLYSLQQTLDGGYILGGASNSDSSGDKTQDGRGGYDCWMIKIDANGNKQWDKRFGGDKDDYCLAVKQTSDGGYIIGGQSNSNAVGDKSQPSWGGIDYWLIRLDTSGTKLWDKRYGTVSGASLTSVQQTTDGGFILAGYTADGISDDKTQPTKGGNDYWIVKTDSLGDKLWDSDFGGSDNDKASSITQAFDGGYLVCGSSASPANGDRTENKEGCRNMWLVKMDSSGNKQWDKTIFDSGNDDTGNVLQTTDGGYAFVNSTNADTGGYKTQPNWDTSTDTVMCRLFITNDYWIVKFHDTSACPLLYAGIISASRDTICAGTLARVNVRDSRGTLQWQSSTTFTDFKNIPGAVTSSYFQIISQSTYYRTITGNGICGDTSSIFAIIVVPAPAAHFTWSVNGPATVSFNADGSTDPAKMFWDFGDGDTSNLRNPVHTYDTVLLHHVCLTVSNSTGCNFTLCQNVIWDGVNNIAGVNNMKIYPNPFSNNFYISLPGINDIKCAEVYNVLGQMVLRTDFKQGENNILNVDAAALAKGIYYIKIKTQQQDYIQPVVKQ